MDGRTDGRTNLDRQSDLQSRVHATKNNYTASLGFHLWIEGCIDMRAVIVSIVPLGLVVFPRLFSSVIDVWKIDETKRLPGWPSNHASSRPVAPRRTQLLASETENPDIPAQR